MRVVGFFTTGGPNVLREREVHVPIPREDEVLIKVAAAAVNREDLWRRMGTYYSPKYDTSPYLGCECSGEVVEIGSRVFTFKKGDKVCAIARGGGAYAEFVPVPAIHTARIPEALSLIDAAALPQSSCLVLYCLSLFPNISHGKKILINGADGGFGTIAVQYANILGFEVFATTASNENAQLCKELGAKVSINYRDDFWWEHLTSEAGEGFNLIIDLIGRLYFPSKIKFLVTGGTFITIACLTGSYVHLDLRLLGEKEITFVGASLRKLSADDLQNLLREAERCI